jgi:predicted dehydrogenase
MPVPTIIQVGLGTWGRDWATKVFSEIPEMKLVGCVDAWPEALKAICKTGVVTANDCFSSVAEAIEEKNPDAVLVTTDREHGAIVREALNAGRHVLCEKPFVGSVSEARELADLAASAGRTLMVSQNYRFFPAARAAQDVVRSGELGRLLHIDVEFRRFHAAGRHIRWRHPLLLDIGIHHFDLMRAVTGREPRSVQCWTWNPAWCAYQDAPEAAALVDFGDGLTVSYRSSRLNPERPTPWAGEWLMYFERGSVVWTSRGDLSGLRSAEGDALVVYREEEAPVQAELPSVDMVDRAGALDAFTRALADGTTPETSAAENVGSLALAYGAIRSAETRAPVQLTTAAG